MPSNCQRSLAAYLVFRTDMTIVRATFFMWKLRDLTLNSCVLLNREGYGRHGDIVERSTERHFSVAHQQTILAA